MTIAYWCVLAVLLAPYLLSVLSRIQAPVKEYVDDPRAYSEKLTGWYRRAHLAHLNAFEAVPPIIAGVMVAELADTPRIYVDTLALAYVGFRVLHAVCYIADWSVLRSHAWRFGMIIAIGLFVVAAIYGGR